MPVISTLNSTANIKPNHTRHSEVESGLGVASGDQPQSALSKNFKIKTGTRDHDASAVQSHDVADIGLGAYEVASETYEHGLFDAKQLAQVARCVLGHLAQTGQLQLDCYREREPGLYGYGKFLLYSHTDEQYPFCLQLFAFKPGQKTPLHDHPCECMSLVVRGAVMEEVYDAERSGAN